MNTTEPEGTHREGHAKMVPPMTDDSRTPWQRFEDVARKVFAVKKADIPDLHKPIMPRSARKK